MIVRNSLLILLLVATGSVLASPLRAEGQEEAGTGQAGEDSGTAAQAASDAPAEAGAEPKAPAESGTAVQEVKPAGLYLRNNRGELVYVPDVTYEQVEQLLKEQRNLATPQRPAFSMKLMTVTGEVVEDRLEAVVEYTLAGLRFEGLEKETWFRVPLKFNKAYLREEPRFEGPGKHFLTFEEQAGYVFWLHTSEAGEHRVSLPLLIPITRVGEESRVELQTPSPLASRLSITVPEHPAEGVIQELAGDEGRPLTYSTDDEGRGLLSARGIRGDVSVSWRESHGAEEQAEIRLDVKGSIEVTANELLHEVRSEGHFEVRGFGRPVEVFQVRLPPGMQLRETPEPGYEVRPLPSEEDAGGEGQLVEVRMDNPTSGEANIRLVAELPSGEDDAADQLTVSKLVDASEEFMPARFQFQGAVRHRGRIDLVVKGDWSLRWAEDAALLRTEPNGGAATNGLSARFRYHNQTRALRVWIRRQPARIDVEPAYDVVVDERQARLIARLLCRTSGSKAGSVKFSMPGWTAERVGFPNLDSSLPVDMSGETLVIPIPVEAQAASRFTLRIEARHDLTADVLSSESPLELELPTVTAQNPARTNLIVSPATVRVIPADNILLTPRPDDMSALSPLIVPIPGGALQPSTPNVSVPSTKGSDYETPVFQYRDRGSAEKAVFAADFKIQPQSISVSVASTVRIDRRSYRVEQQFSYRVLHEPVDTLEFVVPAALLDDDGGNLRMLLDDEPLIPSPVEEEASQGKEENQKHRRLQVGLPEPILGPVELRMIHQPQPISALRMDETVELLIPLVRPFSGGGSNTTVIGNTLTVQQQGAMRVELAGGAWTRTESDSGPGKLVLTTSSGGGEVAIDVSLSGESRASSTILDQVWIQTWLANAERRDRAVFRVRTGEPELRVRVPRRKSGAISAVEAAVDHRRVDTGPLKEEDAATLITVPIDAGEDAESHVVELWYRMPLGNQESGRLVFQSPRLEAVDHVKRCYWQLVLPRDRIVMSGSETLYHELQWQGWTGWQRTPLREQQELERWIGAVRQDGVPPGMNTYLFTSFGAPRQLAVVAGTRTLVLLIASGVALSVGLVLIYFPILRHPAVLLLLGILLLALALAAPELAVLVAQAASLGIVLTLGARLLRSVLLRMHPGKPTVQGRVSDSKLMELRYSRSDGSSRISTAPAPAVIHAPSTESRSESNP